MKTDEFAFFNQQLAAMLRDGIPLEGALQRLCTEMQDAPLRAELQTLAADLTQGVPLPEAIRRRQLPELYRCLVEVGAQSNDLPGVLTLLADHYQRRYHIWTRLKGLMVYPFIVLTASLVLSVLLAYVLEQLVWPSLTMISQQVSPGFHAALWMSPVLLALLLVVAIVALTVPAARQMLRWRVPSFRESSLAQIASALALLLRNGVALDHALALVERMESGSRAGGGNLQLAPPARRRSRQVCGPRATGPRVSAVVHLARGAWPGGPWRRIPTRRRHLPIAGQSPCRTVALLRAAVFHPRARGIDHHANPADLFRAVEGDEPARLGITPTRMNDFPDLLLRLGLVLAMLCIWALVLGGGLALLHFLVSLPMRRAERARALLDLMETALRLGEPVEQALISISQSREQSLGVRFHLFVAWLENGLHLPEALAKVPRLLPPQIVAMLRAGERIGDLRKILPACRQLLADAVSETRSALNYLVVIKQSTVISDDGCKINPLSLVPIKYRIIRFTANAWDARGRWVNRAHWCVA